jgi:hypothetical protein
MLLSIEPLISSETLPGNRLQILQEHLEEIRKKVTSRLPNDPFCSKSVFKITLLKVTGNVYINTINQCSKDCNYSFFYFKSLT